ncbi:MAG TPA: hypothetical protein PLB88_02305 [Thermoanaerobaculaceae bacterium]|nr:MAG: hypothetical protein B7Z61_00150 [Acidobacteria bacterium 37-71-11]HQT93620.1 hypothetical protein [Thermoanaerobaculaceae bacterium]HQU33122.1 hypothetical protein [Thermoanaerobaculaceae bacterium]
MFELPPIPTWDGLHPLIVHFPIALLLVAPLFIVLALLVGRHSTLFMTSALVLMVLGTAASYVAVSTGEAAGKLADRTPEVNQVLQHHEQLAERTRLTFTVLTIVFAGLLAGPAVLKRPLARVPATVLTLLFLGVYGAGAIVLANTAHNGGRLVHELGVRSLMPPAPIPVASADLDD